MNYKLYILMILISCMVALTACGETSYLMVEEDTDLADETSDDEPSGVDVQDSIIIYVAGAVRTPGVFTLPEGSRIADAIEAAGGLADDADIDDVNLAERISDGQKITIYTAEEAETVRLAAAEEASEGGITADGRVNINTASKEELMTLAGIGESKAEAIIDYREDKGSFSDIAEVKNISGIKDGVYAKIEDNITVG